LVFKNDEWNDFLVELNYLENNYIEKMIQAKTETNFRYYQGRIHAIRDVRRIIEIAIGET